MSLHKYLAGILFSYDNKLQKSNKKLQIPIDRGGGICYNVVNGTRRPTKVRALKMPKNPQLLSDIKEFAEEYYFEFGRSPSVREIAAQLNVGKSTVQRYLEQLNNSGEIEYNGRRGIHTDAMDKLDTEGVNVGVVGTISCGALTFAEQNITDYFRLPASMLGNGEFFMLTASGNSMINAGIDDGDLVVIRRQAVARDGDIVVALYGDETTLKRFYKDVKNQRFILHPENEELDDIIVEGDLVIQGVAVKVIKDLI